MDDRLFSRSSLARAAGCSLKALRVYEARGLLPRRLRTGRRRFDSADFARLRLIMALRSLGYSTGKIGRLLALRPTDYAHVPTAAQNLAAEIGDAVRDVSAQVELFQRIRQELIAARESLFNCQTCGSAGPRCDQCKADGVLGPTATTLLFER